MSEWRMLVTRINGDGTETIEDFDLPGTDPQFTKVLSGGIEASVAIKPQFAHLLDETGEFTIRRWQSAVFFEEDGEIRAGGIYVDGRLDVENATIVLELSGYANYPADMPYTGSWVATEIDPLDVFRHIWDHLQSQPGGNLGVQVDTLKSPVRIGKLVAQGQFDTENGPLAFEYEPVKLAWYQTHDLGDYISKLSENTPFDFVEEHRWNADRTAIEHFIRLGYPRLGRVRDDIRLVVDENIAMPKLVAPALDYASEVLALGAGEGAAMLRASAYRADEQRIRRVAVVEEKNANSPQAINATAQAEIRQRLGGDRVTQIDALPSADELSSLEPGDIVRLIGTLADPQAATTTTEQRTVTIDERFGSFNINGIKPAAHFTARLPEITSKIIASGASVLGLQEANSAGKDQPDRLIDSLHAAGHTGWKHFIGPNLNVIIVDTNIFEPQWAKTRDKHLGDNKYASAMLLKHKLTGLQLTYWTTHYLPGDEQAKRAKHTRVLVPWLGDLPSPTIGGGDFNTNATGSTFPVGILRKAGYLETRDLVSSVVNGNYNSLDRYEANPMDGSWIDHLFVAGGLKPSVVGLFDSGGASDHNIIYTDIEWTRVVDEVVTLGHDNWVKITSKTVTPDEAGLSFEIAVPDTI